MRYIDTVQGHRPRLSEWIRTAFEQGDAIAIRTGFLSTAAVVQLEPAITAFLEHGGKILIIAGGAPDQADPDALVRLGELIRPYPLAALRVVLNPEEFQNAKIYHVSFGDGHSEALVGSPNLTNGGLESNHEAAVILDSREPGEAELAESVLRGIEEFRDRPGSVPVREDTRLLLAGRQARLARHTGRGNVRALQPTLMLEELLQPAIDHVDTVATSGGSNGVPTGFTELDELTGGLARGSLTVIGSRPSIGRSTLLLDIFRNTAIKYCLRSLIFCLDRTPEELMSHILAAEAKIRRHDMRTGRMNDDDWRNLARRMSEISEVPLLINTSPRPSLSALCEHAASLHQDEPLQLVAIDPMSLINAELDSNASRERELSVIARRLKLLALELNIPVVVTAELGRTVEQRTDKKPVIGDLRESDTLAQVADNVLLLHRPDAHERDDPRAGLADLILAKHREGPTAAVTVAHQLHLGKFVDMARR